MLQIRQGDVLLVEVEDERAAQRLRRASGVRQHRPDDGRLVLAEGEATGHAHVIASDATSLLTVPGEATDFLFVDGDEDVVLSHDEHDPLAVPPGLYRLVRQREYQEADRWDWVHD